jgi:hypothetical protein
MWRRAAAYSAETSVIVQPIQGAARGTWSAARMKDTGRKKDGDEVFGLVLKRFKILTFFVNGYI